MAIREIGLGGALVETAFPLSLDSLHDIRLTLGDHSVVLKARVAHSRIGDVDQDAVQYHSGLNFTEPPAHVQTFADVYAKGYGIHFRHHNTSQGWDLYAVEGRKIVEGESSLGPGLTELNRRMNDLVKFGGCQPYAGLRHPITP